MSLLTDDEIEAIRENTYLGFMAALREQGHAKRDPLTFARAIESAVLAKLAGMELPEAVPVLTVNGHNLHTADQLRQAYAQGAASVLSAEPSNVFTKINGEWVSGKPGNKEPS